MRRITKKTGFLKNLLLIVVFIAICAALVGATNQQIQVYLASDVTVRYNHNEQAFKDAEGTTVYPIIYNGTTYLPIRAVSEMLGLQVAWEDETRTVLLSNRMPGDPERLIDVCTIIGNRMIKTTHM